MIRHIERLPISEEMLGAYLEGNLTEQEAQQVEQLVESSDTFSEFMDELSLSDDLTLNYSVDDIPSFGDDFLLPDIPADSVPAMESQVSPFESELPFSEVIDSMIALEVAEEDEVLAANEVAADGVLAVSEVPEEIELLAADVAEEVELFAASEVEDGNELLAENDVTDIDLYDFSDIGTDLTSDALPMDYDV